MAFQKKEWKNRLSEFPNRRRLEPTGIENTYDVVRAEGNVTETGDPFAEDSMNDMEERIAEGFKETAGAADLTAHTIDTTVHITAAEHAALNAAVQSATIGGSAVTKSGTTLQLPAYPTTLPANGGTAADTTAITSSLTVSTAAPTSTLAAGKLWGVY